MPECGDNDMRLSVPSLGGQPRFPGQSLGNLSEPVSPRPTSVADWVQTSKFIAYFAKYKMESASTVGCIVVCWCWYIDKMCGKITRGRGPAQISDESMII